MSIRNVVRAALSRSAPAVLEYYRQVRDAKASDAEARRFVETQFGFSLAGHPYLEDGDWEVSETKCFLQYIEHSDVCVDIGANVGFYSCLAASRGRTVLAIEPLPANLRFLYANLVHNGFAAEVFPVGLSSNPGLERLYGAARVASFVKGWAESVETRFTYVPTTTLDALVAYRFAGARLIIKLDVEGFELSVLAGAVRTLTLQPRPVWIVEILLKDRAVPGGVNDRFHEVFNVFWRNGYTARRVVDSRVLRPEEVRSWIEHGNIDGEPNFLFT